MSGLTAAGIAAAGVLPLCALAGLVASARRQRVRVSRLQFTAPVDAGTLCECIAQRVNARTSALVVTPGLYQSKRSPNRIVYVWGSLMSTSVRAQVVTRTAGHGSTGFLELVGRGRSTFSGRDDDVLAPVIDRIKSAVSDAGGSSSEPRSEQS